ncbi:MAG TPA: HD domain-containing protein, partial [Actinomycetota bacterium]|nr:HD domain-containing protein [Actinomycetota bacterium]
MGSQIDSPHDVGTEQPPAGSPTPASPGATPSGTATQAPPGGLPTAPDRAAPGQAADRDQRAPGQEAPAQAGAPDQAAPEQAPPDQPTQRRGARIPRPRLRRSEPEPPSRVVPLVKKVRGYNPKADLKVLERAYGLAERAHRGQTRKSGEEFIEHPLAVANIVADLRLDTTTLAAALLHDTVEDTDVSLEQLQAEFGDDIVRIVDGLTKLDKLEFRTRELAQAENVRKMIVAMAGDSRVLLIKLADRLHNMRTLSALSAQKQQRIATETLEIYAPLANRLGVQ